MATFQDILDEYLKQEVLTSSEIQHLLRQTILSELIISAFQSLDEMQRTIVLRELSRLTPVAADAGVETQPESADNPSVAGETPRG